ncbi:MAG: ATP synthase protein I [bacterium]|jgi:ATP synthase protein I
MKPKDMKFKEYLEFTSIGLEMGLAVILGVVGGSWLDERFGTAPWMLFFGVICGFAAGLRSIIRLLMKKTKGNKENNEQSSGSDGDKKSSDS